MKVTDSGFGQVLVVDDDPCCREFMCLMLTEMGISVQQTESGHEAYEMICQGDVRIVISDWQMPGMNGIELCHKVRKRLLGDYVYFILLTSLSGREFLVQGLKAGADDFLTKPIDPDELHVRLRVAERVVQLGNRELIVFSLAKLAESRDPETGVHLERMREYSRLLTRRLAQLPKYSTQIDADFIRAVYLTSPLHDIGKVGIPDNILLKPGKLTVDEFEIMKQHAIIGCKTLDAAYAACPSAEYLRLARDIACSHHERWDGSGYPYGLVGDEIPLCARIVALADVYDALTTKRVYKDAYTHAVARKIIVDSSGTHFDPDVVSAFLELEEDFQQVKSQLDEPNHVPLPVLPTINMSLVPQLA